MHALFAALIFLLSKIMQNQFNISIGNALLMHSLAEFCFRLVSRCSCNALWTALLLPYFRHYWCIINENCRAYSFINSSNKCDSTCLAPYFRLNSIRLEVSPSAKPTAKKCPKKSPEKYSKSKHKTQKSLSSGARLNFSGRFCLFFRVSRRK